MIQKEQVEFTRDVARLIDYAASIGVDLTFGEAYRTKEQQEIHLKAGRSKTMNSNHLRRLAVDFNFFINGALVFDSPRIAELGAFWESLNPHNRWGGNFKSIKDNPHFERNA